MYFKAFLNLNFPAVNAGKKANSSWDILGIQKGNWSRTLSSSDILTFVQPSWLEGLGGLVKSKE